MYITEQDIEGKKTLNIAIIGSRSFNDYDLLKNKLLEFVEDDLTLIGFIVSGGARGADSLGKRFAEEHNIKTLIYPADWKKHGKSAGYIRNQTIIDNSDCVYAFWDGDSKGTLHSIELAKKQGKPVIVEKF